MGIISYIKLSEIYPKYDGPNNITDSPFIIIIPNNETLDTYTFTIHQKIKIKVKAIRIKYNASNIQVIGEFISE